MFMDEWLQTITEPLNFSPCKAARSFLTLFWAFYVGFYIPIKHIFSSQQTLPELFEKINEKQTYEFYVRRPQKLTPRRPVYIKSLINGPAKFLHTIIQVEPIDIVEEMNIKALVLCKPKHLAPSSRNINLPAVVHKLPEVTD